MQTVGLYEPMISGTLVFPEQYLGKIIALCEVSEFYCVFNYCNIMIDLGKREREAGCTNLKIFDLLLKES